MNLLGYLFSRSGFSVGLEENVDKLSNYPKWEFGELLAEFEL